MSPTYSMLPVWLKVIIGILNCVLASFLGVFWWPKKGDRSWVLFAFALYALVFSLYMRT